jgi:hypothetical protein
MPRKKKPTPMETIELAVTYIEDGALMTGVKLLREATDAIEAIAVKRNAELEKYMGKRKPKAPAEGGA